MAEGKAFWKFWRLVRAKGIRGFMTPFFRVLWLNGAENWDTASIRWGWEFYFWPSALVITEGMTHYAWRWDKTYGVSKEVVTTFGDRVSMKVWKERAKKFNKTEIFLETT